MTIVSFNGLCSRKLPSQVIHHIIENNTIKIEQQNGQFYGRLDITRIGRDDSYIIYANRTERVGGVNTTFDLNCVFDYLDNIARSSSTPITFNVSS